MAWAERTTRPERHYGVRDERSASIRAEWIPDCYHMCARERIRDPYFQGVIIPGQRCDLVKHAIVRTNYIPLYRIHSKTHLHLGDDFPRNWESSARKRSRADRYSPFGTEAHYFGLTLAGAENEALYYSDGFLDPVQSLLFVLDLCLDGILDLLSSQLKHIWILAGLDPDLSIDQMYVRLMDPNTDNPATNAIGLWARRQPGVRGLIYPSARYGQLDWIAKGVAQGMKPVPLINRVSVGSHLDRTFTAACLDVAHSVLTAHDMRKQGEFPVSAEANIALFDNTQLLGRETPVFYQTCHLDERGEVAAEDEPSRQRSFLIRFGSDAWFSPGP